jgi:hypothetical protein
MFTTQIELYNYPPTFVASAEARNSGIRVVVEDTSASFMDIFKDSSSVSKEFSCDDYERGILSVSRVAEDLAEDLFFNQLTRLKKLAAAVD